MYCFTLLCNTALFVLLQVFVGACVAQGLGFLKVLDGLFLHVLLLLQQAEEKVSVSIFGCQFDAGGSGSDTLVYAFDAQVETRPFGKVGRLLRCKVAGARNVEQGLLPHAQLGFALVAGVKEYGVYGVAEGVVLIVVGQGLAVFSLVVAVLATGKVVGCNDASRALACGNGAVEQSLYLGIGSLQVALGLGSLVIQFAAVERVAVSCMNIS